MLSQFSSIPTVHNTSQLITNTLAQHTPSSYCDRRDTKVVTILGLSPVLIIQYTLPVTVMSHDLMWIKL